MFHEKPSKGFMRSNDCSCDRSCIILMRFRPRFHRRTSNTMNSTNSTEHTTPDGVDVLCRQIAGAMARRIVTYAKEGEDCYIDEHLGFIKLGSRVDVYLPLGSEVLVKMGQKTVGDQTVIAKLARPRN